MAIDLAKLNQIIQTAFEETVEDFAAQCQQEITSPVWDWEGETRRRNGQVVSSPRDIVDTEDLKNSLGISMGNGEAEVFWDSDHAAVAHEGRTDVENYSGRPWTETAQQEIDLEKTLARRIRQGLR